MEVFVLFVYLLATWLTHSFICFFNGLLIYSLDFQKKIENILVWAMRSSNSRWRPTRNSWGWGKEYGSKSSQNVVKPQNTQADSEMRVGASRVGV